MQMEGAPLVANVRCQVCVSRPLWDGDDYHGNYSAFEQSLFCAQHWEAHLSWELVFVCRHAWAQGTRRHRGTRRRKRVQGLQLSWDKAGGGRTGCCTFCFQPRLVLLHRLGLEVEHVSVIFIFQLGESWLGPRPSSLYGFFSSFCFPHHVLCILLCALFIPKPGLWFNIHDKFYSYVHIHYPLDYTPRLFPDSCSTAWEIPSYSWPPSSRKSLTLWLRNDPPSPLHLLQTHRKLIIIPFCRLSLMSLAVFHVAQLLHLLIQLTPSARVWGGGCLLKKRVSGFNSSAAHLFSFVYLFLSTKAKKAIKWLVLAYCVDIALLPWQQSFFQKRCKSSL